MKTFKNILYFLILTLHSLGASSLIENTVSGTVMRSENNAPLSGANVVFKAKSGDTFGAATDITGAFKLKNIPAGDYSIVISFIGFQDFKDNLAIEEDKAYKVNAVLSIQPIVMAKLEITSNPNNEFNELPGAASVLDSKTIRTIDPIGTQEALELIPGVNGYSDDGMGNSRLSIGIRGLNPRRSSRVLILEDGIPIQPALYIYPNMYYNPPADRIDRIEVIKGSGAIRFGPQTMGGVINYFTMRPRADFGGHLKLKAGENGYRSLFAEVGGFGSQNLNPGLQILFKRGDGFRQNNVFEQANGTFKLNYNKSAEDNIYIKANLNYENSNATYTGLTQWSFDNNPKFNPKENDNFKVLRSAFDLIRTQRVSSKLVKTSMAYLNYFDRRWWRENDVFISASDLGNSDPTPQPYYSSNNLIRTGNGKDSFGILRTFYVLGYEQSYSFDSRIEFGGRVYWERFIDDKQTGSAPNSRDGIYFIPAASEDESPTVVGQSHHYETTAFSGHITGDLNIKGFNIKPGSRLEIFEQERVDRLAGSTYQDKTLIALLPGIGFTKNIFGANLFGGVHRGFTPPSSGALKILNFGSNTESTGLDIEAEKSWNKELGIRGNISWFDYELSGFHIGIENLVAAGRGTAFKNLGKVNTFGIETNVNINISKLTTWLPNIHLVYTLLNTEVGEGIIKSNVSGSAGLNVSIKGKELPYAPLHTLTAGISNALNKLSYRVDFRYVSDVFTDFENIKKADKIGISGIVPAYSFINLSADYQINSSLRAFISAKNLTDQIYIGSRLHSNPGQPAANLSSGILPGPRRQISLGLDYSF